MYHGPGVQVVALVRAAAPVPPPIIVVMPDIIADFAPGTDKIDVSGIDAIAATAANDAFTFIGSAAFSHQAGQLRFETVGGQTSIHADIDGDGFADMQIMLQTAVALTAGDFVL